MGSTKTKSLCGGVILAALAPAIMAPLVVRAQSKSSPASEDAGYVSPAVCAGCHREIWETYQRTGMARSFYRPSLANTVEDYSNKNTFYHKASDSYFTMLRRDGKYYQRRCQIDPDGRQVNVMEKRIDYITGSGNHARAYLHRTERGTLIELPLGWYAEKGGYWAMNPGYDRPHHDGFRRPITYDCMFCHNAYPQIRQEMSSRLRSPYIKVRCPKASIARDATVPAANTRNLRERPEPGRRTCAARSSIRRGSARNGRWKYAWCVISKPRAFRCRMRSSDMSEGRSPTSQVSRWAHSS